MADSDKTIQPHSMNSLLADLRVLILSARKAVAHTVDSIQVVTNFEIGRRIVEHEQQGSERAEYGKALLKELSAILTEEFGRGFSRSNLEYMRKFYLTYRERLPEKSQMASGKLPQTSKSQTPSDKLPIFKKTRTVSAQWRISSRVSTAARWSPPSGRRMNTWPLRQGGQTHTDVLADGLCLCSSVCVEQAQRAGGEIPRYDSLS